ncbi:hypothetical protein IFM89_026895 [Coptis chinensis]|uniref:Uncharacterized protein n=1 Tax=Coptis chinensis TaxID=261450 RepID=A0A835IEY3_9MAGN|nr:hypothetical protein IFM89_026895 [Coptis chinensis]
MLNSTFCNKMTNANVVAMSKNYPDLVVFRLCIMGRHLPDHLIGEPMDMGFGAIVMNCKKLRRLAVSGLLTDKAFYYIDKMGSGMLSQWVSEKCDMLFQKREQSVERMDAFLRVVTSIPGIDKHNANAFESTLQDCRSTQGPRGEVARVSLPKDYESDALKGALEWFAALGVGIV